jgi:hypothetical protein
VLPDVPGAAHQRERPAAKHSERLPPTSADPTEWRTHSAAPSLGARAAHGPRDRRHNVACDQLTPPQAGKRRSQHKDSEPIGHPLGERVDLPDARNRSLVGPILPRALDPSRHGEVNRSRSYNRLPDQSPYCRPEIISVNPRPALGRGRISRATRLLRIRCVCRARCVRRTRYIRRRRFGVPDLRRSRFSALALVAGFGLGTEASGSFQQMGGFGAPFQSAGRQPRRRSRAGQSLVLEQGFCRDARHADHVRDLDLRLRLVDPPDEHYDKCPDETLLKRLGGTPAVLGHRGQGIRHRLNLHFGCRGCELCDGQVDAVDP